MGLQQFVAEIALVVDDIGTQETFMFSTSGFATRPTDTPPNTCVAPRLKSAGSLRRELFSGTRVFGAVRPSFGELVLFNGDGGLDAWMGYGVSGGRVVIRMGDSDAAYPDGYTTVYVAYAQSLVADFSTVRVRLRDRLRLLDTPLVSQSFAGTGGIEGESDAKGKVKQWASGVPSYFPPVLIDRTKQLYYVMSTPGSIDVHEGGTEIVKEANYSSEVDLLGVAPSPGYCRVWHGPSGVGPVYVRLGGVPTLELRILARAGKPGGGAWSIPDLAALGGVTGGAGSIPVGSTLVSDGATLLAVMESSAKSSLAYFGMTRLDTFVCAQFQSPDDDHVATFGAHNSRAWTRQPVQDMDAPVWSLNVSAGKTWPCTLATGVGGYLRDYMTRAPWVSTFSRQDEAIKTANPGAVSESIEIDGNDFVRAFDKSDYLDSYFGLFGARREFYSFAVPMTPDNIALELHDTVQIKLPRFGLGAGKNMRIITQQIDCDSRQITYGVWG